MTTNLLQETLTKYGAPHQLRLLQEECAELIVEINHYFRGRSGLEKVFEEMADVQILLEQMKLTDSGKEHFQKSFEQKIERLRGVVESKSD